MRIYALYDRKVGEYGSLVLATNDEAVKRALVEGLPANSTQAKYPHDFDLQCLGEFDPVSGEVARLPLSLVGSIHDILGGA